MVERVDAAFEGWWDERGLTPAKPASDLTLARRLSLALLGTIPSLEEIRRFESLPEGSRFPRLLAERLADRRYPDYVAERLARAYVGVEDGPFLLYRRRRFVAWLAEQLATREPYDRLVRHLIADGGLWTDTPSTNFITVTIKPDQNTGPDENQLAGRVARAFLGVRIDCAECHDHPFDRWKQGDFQGLAAFFGSTRHSLRGIRDVPGRSQVENRQTGEISAVECQVPFGQAWLPHEGSARARLAAWVTDPANRSFARLAVNRAWALLFGRPFVEPIDQLPLDDLFPKPFEILADDFVEHGYDFQRLLAVIASTRAFAMESRRQDDTPGQDTAEHEAAWAVFPLTRLRPEQVVGALLQSTRLATTDASSHIVLRVARQLRQREFLERYGDNGADEFDVHGGTIAQRLILMNGKIVGEKTKDDLLSNAATQIAALAPTDNAAVETAMLAVLSRRPNAAEQAVFCKRLIDRGPASRAARLGDIYWILLNST
ncbi:MAG TPA: DUF1549 domain-containing protein, partial [Pirellulales bacterium]|nr:DUF1549 domain-containing protein [Pirellulales bacterium]